MLPDLYSRLRERVRRRTLAYLLLILCIVTYFSAFLYLRQGANSAGYPLMYIFSTEAIENDRLVTIFTPIIWVSGGRITSPDYKMSMADELPLKGRPVYLRSNHRMWSRIGSHFETLQSEIPIH
jgi:hypothetical protein